MKASLVRSRSIWVRNLSVIFRLLWLGAKLLVCVFLVNCAGPNTDPVGKEFRRRWLAKTNAKTVDKTGKVTNARLPYDDITSQAMRNQFIDEFVLVKDIQFRNYVTNLRRGVSFGELGADTSRLVLDGLAAITGSASAKSGLAASSAMITGFTGAVKKDVLFNQSVPIFIEKMIGLRAVKRTDIIAKKKLSLENYSAVEAYADVEEYGALGTFDAALNSIQITTSLETGKAKADLARANGDNNMSTHELGAYTGTVEGKIVTVAPAKLPPPDIQKIANAIRLDLTKINDQGIKKLLDAGSTYAVLKAEMDANPQGETDDREYLGRLINNAANKDDNLVQLKAWRSIIPVNPAVSPPDGV